MKLKEKNKEYKNRSPWKFNDQTSNTCLETSESEYNILLTIRSSCGDVKAGEILRNTRIKVSARGTWWRNVYAACIAMLSLWRINSDARRNCPRCRTATILNINYPHNPGRVYGRAWISHVRSCTRQQSAIKLPRRNSGIGTKPLARRWGTIDRHLELKW